MDFKEGSNNNNNVTPENVKQNIGENFQTPITNKNFEKLSLIDIKDKNNIQNTIDIDNVRKKLTYDDENIESFNK